MDERYQDPNHIWFDIARGKHIGKINIAKVLGEWIKNNMPEDVTVNQKNHWRKTLSGGRCTHCGSEWIPVKKDVSVRKYPLNNPEGERIPLLEYYFFEPSCECYGHCFFCESLLEPTILDKSLVCVECKVPRFCTARVKKLKTEGSGRDVRDKQYWGSCGGLLRPTMDGYTCNACGKNYQYEVKK